MSGARQSTSSLFTRATSVFSAIIDDILEPRPEAPIENSSLHTMLDFNDEVPFLFDLQGIDLVETQDFQATFDNTLYWDRDSDVGL